MVVGYWGETSTDLDMIIRAIAESMVLYLSRETGRLITDNWVGQVLGQHRRSLLVAFVRAQAACLTSRMGHLGVGAGPGSRGPGGQRPWSRRPGSRGREDGVG